MGSAYAGIPQHWLIVESGRADRRQRVRTEMEAGTDPADERVQCLARRWMGLVNEFTGGDPGVHRSLSNMWEQEENLMGIDTAYMRELIEYISRANAAREKEV